MDESILILNSLNNRVVSSNIRYSCIQIQEDKNIYLLYSRGERHYLNQVMTSIYEYCLVPQKVNDILRYVIDLNNLENDKEVSWLIFKLLSSGRRLGLWSYSNV